MRTLTQVIPASVVQNVTPIMAYVKASQIMNSVHKLGQCSERICGDDGLCFSNDIREGEECSIVGGNACTISTCTSGSCNSIPLDCDDGNECTENICNGLTGVCSHPPKPAGTPCGDGPLDACGGEVCNGDGMCVPATPFCPIRPEADACNQRTECDAELGCGPFPDGTPLAGCPIGQTCCGGECCGIPCTNSGTENAFCGAP